MDALRTDQMPVDFSVILGYLRFFCFRVLVAVCSRQDEALPGGEDPGKEAVVLWKK